jgi:hypothetical protein
MPIPEDFSLAGSEFAENITTVSTIKELRHPIILKPEVTRFMIRTLAVEPHVIWKNL